MRQVKPLTLKSITVSLLLIVVALTMLSICGLHWNEDWSDLRRVLRSTEKTTFSVSAMMGSSNVYEVVKPNVSTILMEPSNPFSENREGGTKRPFATVLVTSMARFFQQRRAIRNTWYKWAQELNIRVFFVVGFHGAANEVYQILGEEQRQHNDLIIDDYEEGYYKLPGKVLRMLKWYNSTYTDENSPRFLIKTDHDVFLNLPNIVASLKGTSYYSSLSSGCKNPESEEHLQSSISSETSDCVIPDNAKVEFDSGNPTTYFIGGRRFENPEIEKDPDSKWYIDSSERKRLSWSSNVYPTYLNGPCYIMSGNVVKSIYETSFQVPIYPFEDVYIVGMIAYDRLNLYISNMEEMYLNKKYLCFVRTRSKIEKLLAMHPVSSAITMKKLCKRIRSCNVMLKSGGIRLGENLWILIIAAVIGVRLFR